MARTEKDVEAYLFGLGRSWERLESGAFVVQSANETPTVVAIAGDLVVVRVLIGAFQLANPERESRLFRCLLEHNASDLIHCAYGIEENHIVLSASLQIENLDMNELAGVLDDIDIALVRDVNELRKLCETD